MNQEVQNLISEAITYDDSVIAVQVLSMAQKDHSITLDPFDSIKLKYVRLNSLNGRQLLDLLQRSILTAYQIPEYDFNARMQVYFELMDNMAGQADLIKKILLILQTSEELIGTNNIVIDDMAVKPTIGNWLTDYLHRSKNTQDGFSKATYFNKSPNLKNLTDPEVEILKNLIEFLEYCDTFMVLWESTPVPKQADIEKDFDQFQLIPGLDPDEVAEIVPEVPEVKPPAPTPTPKPISDIKIQPVQKVSTPYSVPIPKPAQPGQVNMPTPKTLAQLFPQGQAPAKPIIPAQPPQVPKKVVPDKTGGALIHDLINKRPEEKRGVVKDPTNVKLVEEQARIKLDRLRQARKIQDKLEELRNRKE